MLCLFCKKNVGPASTTLDRHWSSTGFASSHTRLAAPEVCWSIMNTRWCTGVVSVLVHRLRHGLNFGTTLGRHVVLRSLIRNVIHTLVVHIQHWYGTGNREFELCRKNILSFSSCFVVSSLIIIISNHFQSSFTPLCRHSNAFYCVFPSPLVAL